MVSVLVSKVLRGNHLGKVNVKFKQDKTAREMLCEGEIGGKLAFMESCTQDRACYLSYRTLVNDLEIGKDGSEDVFILPNENKLVTKRMYAPGRGDYKNKVKLWERYMK